MKYRFLIKKVSVKDELKENFLKKLSKLENKIHLDDKTDGKVNIEIEKTEENHPKKGVYKIEIHYLTSSGNLNIKAQSRNLKIALNQAYNKLKQNLLKFHKKLHNYKQT